MERWGGVGDTLSSANAPCQILSLLLQTLVKKSLAVLVARSFSQAARCFPLPSLGEFTQLKLFCLLDFSCCCQLPTHLPTSLEPSCCQRLLESSVSGVGGVWADSTPTCDITFQNVRYNRLRFYYGDLNISFKDTGLNKTCFDFL